LKKYRQVSHKCCKAGENVPNWYIYLQTGDAVHLINKDQDVFQADMLLRNNSQESNWKIILH